MLVCHLVTFVRANNYDIRTWLFLVYKVRLWWLGHFLEGLSCFCTYVCAIVYTHTLRSLLQSVCTQRCCLHHTEPALMAWFRSLFWDRLSPGGGLFGYIHTLLVTFLVASASLCLLGHQLMSIPTTITFINTLEPNGKACVDVRTLVTFLWPIVR